MASTELYERAREEVLRYAGLSPLKYEAVFLNPSRMAMMEDAFAEKIAFRVQSSDFGLQMGIGALVFRRGTLKKMKPQDTGGGMVKLVHEKFEIYADGAERFETGTPPILNAILLGIALQMIRQSGDKDLFQKKTADGDWQSILSPGSEKGTSLTSFQQSHIGRGVMVPVVNGMKPYVNFDGAASTPSFGPIWQVFCDVLQLPDDAQRTLVQRSLEQLRAFFHAPEAEFDFVFACNTTEAVNFAVRNLAAKDFGQIEPVVVNTVLEHHSNELPWRLHPKFQLVRACVDDEGFIDLLALENLFREYNLDHKHDQQRIVMVAFSGASNVLGSFNPLGKITELCHRYGVQVIIDGAQLSAHRKVDLLKAEVDYYAFSAHKMYSPFGAGGLFIRRGSQTLVEEVCQNGFSNAAGVAALAKAAAILDAIGLDRIEAYERDLTRKALAVLQQFADIRIYGVTDPTAAAFDDKGPVIVFEKNNMPHNLLAKYLAEFGGIGTRNGCFCAHMLVSSRLMKIEAWRPQAVRIIFGLKGNWFRPLLPGLVRISFGIENDEDDIQRLHEAFEIIGTIKTGPINRWLASVHEGTWILPASGAEQAVENFIHHQVGKVFP
jgi:selenocysteine lyase/cysteine desulfurase